MAHNSIDAYVQFLRSKNTSDRVIEENLTQAGWSPSDVKTALEKGVSVEDSIPPAPPGPYKDRSKLFGSISMWDSFEHILLFISMYVLAVTLVLTSMLFIDKWFPGIPTDGYRETNLGYQLSTLRSYMASLIVSFPLFAFFFLRITKRTIEDVSIRMLKSRKFLIYLTLVVTFIILIINVITLVYTFIGGNITVNFFLKFLITLIVSGMIFAYYLYEVREDRQKFDKS